MRTISKVLFVLAILSFVIIFGMKMQNNLEMEQYYLDKEQKAKNELALLQDANGFEITQERIDVINQATEYINKIGDFADWCDTNFYGENVEQCYNIFEDFTNSVDHLAPEIDQTMQQQQN